MTNQATNRPSYGSYRAALLECQHDDWGSFRSIFIDDTPLALFHKVMPAMLSHLENLVFDFWGYLPDHLDEIFNADGQQPLFAECWDDPGEVVLLVKDEMIAHGSKLAESASDESILGEWHHTVESLNEIWTIEAPRPGSYIRVALEADLPTFVRELLQYEASDFDSRLILVNDDRQRRNAVGFDRTARALSNDDAVHLGQLAVLAQAGDWMWTQRSTFQAFWRWVQEFESRN